MCLWLTCQSGVRSQATRKHLQEEPNQRTLETTVHAAEVIKI